MFRLKITRMIFLLAVVSYLVGCSAHQIILPPLFDVQPLEEQIGYFNEEETQCANTYMEFIGQEEDLFLFYVEVENNSEDVLAVYPTEIYLEVVEEAHTQNNMYTKKYFALDPEREIAEINRMMKEEDDRHDLATAGNIFFGILSVAVDLTSDNEYKEENVAVDVISTGVNQVGEEVFHSDIEKDLEEVKEFWKHEVLNESVLNPGDTIGGLVYLPFSNSAEFFKVIVPVCELPESHLFTQMQINK